ncbi:tripartite tricarboxylate transporter substrate binding protein [Alcaligenaceae bacterium]|nr:tripartite tricarboxylate transporter substrate binding protein [Alcaligenaceae bacterium]
MMIPIKRVWLAAFAGLVTLSVAGFATATSESSYPHKKPVRIVVPFGPGSTPDVLTRELAIRLDKKLGQTFVVENLAGASGISGTQTVTRAAPDGYTILAGTIGILAVNQFLYDNISYDVTKDLIPITLFTRNPNVLVVPASLPVDTVEDLIKLGKTRKDPLNYGSSGNGTSLHLAAELFKQKTGMPAVHVPYSKGVMNDLLAGRIDFVFYHISGALPLAQAGKLKILAVGTEKRWPILNQYPTFSEAGVGDFEAGGWIALMAPTGVPGDVVKTLSVAINDILTNDQVLREKFNAQGIEAGGGSPEELQAFIDNERNKWRQVIKTADIQANN